MDPKVVTDYYSAATSCICTHGMSYLDCFYGALTASSCASAYLGTQGEMDSICKV